MGKIKLLPEELVKKIAAGEVIERPASVVKELVENSLDAQAKSITVAVKHGGKQLIRVTDDGEGMGTDDAINSLKRYATSKIQTWEDIFRVKSFGFRGEALPSIAAVSRLTLLTRTSESDFGIEIKATGGAIESVRETGISLGTTVEVLDLFFNIPARRKFLRSEHSEFVAILDSLTIFALGNPEVNFRIYKENKLTADFSACTNLRERIAQVYGLEVVEALVPVQVDTSGIKISGFITAPEVNRVNRTGQYFFINQRPVKSSALSFALFQGYEEMLPTGRFPLAFLFFNLEPSRIDVNVHPNKKEVRIENEREVQLLLIDSVRKALRPKNKFPQTPAIEASFPLQKEYSPIFSLGQVQERLAQWEEKGKKLYFNKSEPVQLGFDKKEPRILGQFQGTYIIAEWEEELIIVDQHAAHERIIYEQILQNIRSAHPPAQLQLIPITFLLDYREKEVLEEYLPLLTKLGFGINDLGRNSFSLDAVPSFFVESEPKQLILDFIHETMEKQFPAKTSEDKIKVLAAGLACKSKTIKGFSFLHTEKATHLLRSLFKTQQPYTCPHGRPTCIRFTNEDLAKQFKRR
ncbi:MAG: DNA mismatch repair endonuclease MutL [Desulfobacterota bacterium]|nr:DNA mismatch repair endonuclease MutL [Thermodesulfobacteriota bacterium]